MKNVLIAGIIAAVLVLSVLYVLVQNRAEITSKPQDADIKRSNATFASTPNSTGTSAGTATNTTSAGSLAGNLTSGSSTPANATPSGSSENIAQIYSSAPGGRQWYDNWHTESHLIYSGDFDPYDAQFQARGDGTVRINGDGTATLNGSAPRMYVYDPTLQKSWHNVEITVYAKRISDKKLSSQGLTAGARSGSHDDVTYPDICTDSVGHANSAYNGRLTFDGRADYVKEVLYHFADAVSNDESAKSPKTAEAFGNLSTSVDAATGFHTFPRDSWIGYKFVVRNIHNNSAVEMETWLDLTDGKDGGHWTKVNEYVDEGGWTATHFYKKDKPWPCPDLPMDYVITTPMPYVYVRADSVNEIDYKNFSIREIDPLP